MHGGYVSPPASSTHNATAHREAMGSVLAGSALVIPKAAGLLTTHLRTSSIERELTRSSHLFGIGSLALGKRTSAHSHWSLR
jgi:hypothetical protein